MNSSTVTYRWLAAWGAMLLLLCNAASAARQTAPRPGKIIVIRGAFTVFSLGLNELGEKLSQRGLDVDVVADISASSAVDQVIEEYRRHKNIGPIVFIGHSRGAELGPREARRLQQYGIPVKLIVMVDAVHETSIPSNVERCVNLYHNNSLGVLHGMPAHAQSKRTKLYNTDIATLKSRSKGGSINHFNIDASPWIHELVIAEVLKACPPVDKAVVDKAATVASRPRKPQRTTTATSPKIATSPKAATSPKTNTATSPQTKTTTPLKTKTATPQTTNRATPQKTRTTAPQTTKTPTSPKMKSATPQETSPDELPETKTYTAEEFGGVKRNLRGGPLNYRIKG